MLTAGEQHVHDDGYREYRSVANVANWSRFARFAVLPFGKSTHHFARGGHGFAASLVAVPTVSATPSETLGERFDDRATVWRTCLTFFSFSDHVRALSVSHTVSMTRHLLAVETWRKEMKVAKLAVVLTMTGVSIALVSQAALAQKSREQVRQELAQTQHEGYTPAGRTQYPPTEASIARNKEIHAAATHQGENAPGADHHDQIAGR